MRFISGLGAALITSVVSLSGCSSAPSPVVANIPLVSGNNIELVNSSVVPVPQGDLSAGSMVQIADTTFQVGQSYRSATGLNCKQLLTTGKHRVARAMCQRNGQWQLLAPLLNRNES
ncbi:hypothetical protein [Aestuariibacter sp. A3R04]|uniref:hypothetical protein n=1 Tax=Aestuariibacter sp. A3R04 TaxID=2841571 RepID=UPI001C082C97|nr:hypothetical protein [Aestuariibacter sp. A3R04]MBU3022095.1 hypothetical protein [Aestuariibacter sp. A3R04]